MLNRLAFGVIFILLLPCLLAAGTSEIYDYRVSGFEYHDYELAVNSLVKSFEEQKKLVPGETGLIALRVYTHSGPGLCTPHKLVLALCKYLERCGFKKENILIVGDSKNSLQQCGYLPRLSQQSRIGLTFHGMPVFWVDDKKFHDERWAYTSTLASDKILLHANFWPDNGPNDLRKSYLPTLLMFGVDGWIDLPIYTGSFEHGVIGSLVHGSIFNISNNKRFLANPTNCAVAAAQIFAIQELKDKFLFTITTLEHFQYCDSLQYNENYTCSSPHVLLSSDPIALDSLCLKVLNNTKKIYKFRFIHNQPAIFRYAEELGVGNSHFTITKVNKKKGSR